MSSLPVIVRFEPTERDMLRLVFAAQRTQPMVLMVSALLFVVLPWWIAWYELTRPLGRIVIGVLFLVMPLVCVAGFVRLHLRMIRDVMRVTGVHTYEFDDAGVHFTGPTSEVRLSWNQVTRCIRTNAGLLFMSGRVPIMSLPARALSDEALQAIGHILERRGIARETIG